MPLAIKDKIWKYKKIVINTVIAGVFLFLGYALQTFGQIKSSVINSAFYTCLYVVFTPFLALMFGKKEEAIVIGDSLSSDIKGAIGYGIDTCWFNPNCNESYLNITYKIKSLNELK